ncbi:MAG: hypothetical protein V2A77_05385 [Pseudomonadota bacterium]
MLRTLLVSFLVLGLLTLTASAACSEPSTEAKAEDRSSEDVRKPPTPAVPIDKGGSLIGSGRIVIEPAVSYSTFSREKVSISGFTIFEAILIGRINVGRINRHIFSPSLTLRYGLKDLELSGKLPYMLRTDDEAFPAGDGTSHFSATDSELGDVEGAAFYHLLSEGGTRPDVVVGVTGKTITGRDPYGLRKKNIKNSQPRLLEFPTGSGHWGIAGTIIFVKTSDPAVLFFNTSYYYNFARNIGQGSSVGYGDIKPGDSAEYSFGLVLGLNEKLAANFSLSQRITWDSSRNGKKQRDSGADSAQANFGWTYAFSRSLSLDVVAGLGLTEDAPDFTVGIRLPITLFL